MKYVHLRIFSLLILTSYQLISFAQDSTYRGREFWAGYGLHQFMEIGSTNGQELIFYLSTQQQPAIVTITIDSSAVPWSHTYNIPANTVLMSDAIPKSGSSSARLYSAGPSFGGTSSTGIFRRKGIHIQSDVAIAVYSHMYGSASAGASLLLPVQTWGYTYKSMNSKQSYAANCYSWAYVIAKEDSTLVEITPTVQTVLQDFTGLQPNLPVHVLLQKGQIYQVLGSNTGADAQGNGGSLPTGHELTGTDIRSLSPGKPVAVFSGSSRTSNPAACGTGGGDNDMAQLFPLHIWGKEYLTAPSSSTISPSTFATHTYKVLVNDPATVVFKNGVLLTGLVNSSYYIYESNTADHLEADKPVMLAQFMTGGSGCISGVGDPDMYYLSPVEAGVRNANVVRSSQEGISENFVTLVILTAGIPTLLINGSNTVDHSYSHPNATGYSVVVRSWPAAVAQISIQSDSAFTGISYGLGNVESYGYNIGANFKPNNGVDPMVPMIWTGVASGDWFDLRNWNTAKVPTIDDHVLIPGGSPFTPEILAGNVANCKSIVVTIGADIHVRTNAILHVSGK